MHASIGMSSVVVARQVGHVKTDSRTGGCSIPGRL